MNFVFTIEPKDWLGAEGLLGALDAYEDSLGAGGRVGATTKRFMNELRKWCEEDAERVKA